MMKKKSPFFTKDKRSLLFICVASSILIHFFVITYFTNGNGATSGEKKYLSHQAAQEKLNKEQMLDKALNEIVIAPSPHLVPFDLEYQPKEIMGDKTAEELTKVFPSEAMAHLLDQKELPLSITPVPPGDLHISELIAIEPSTSDNATISLDKKKNATDLAVDLKLPTISDQFIASFHSPSLEMDASFELNNLAQQPEKVHPDFVTEKPQPLRAPYSGKTEALYVPKTHPSIYAKIPKKNASSPLSSDLTDYKLFESLAVLERDDFTIDLKIMPDEEGPGMVFSATIVPSEKNTTAFKQNVYFLIDRSNSIEKHHFNVFKKSVIRALSVLKPSNNFNIILCDKKIVKFSESSVPATEKNLKKAMHFLEKEQSGGYFSAADIYASLEDLLPEEIAKDEVITAILLSDGESSLTTKKQKAAFSAWVKKNEGKVSLYSAAAGNKNNLLLLDLISRTSRGRLIHSDTLASFPRKLTKLVSTLVQPIARDIVATTIETDNDARITLFSDAYHLQNLYAGQPLTILGHIDSPRDFTLLVQGQDKNHPFTIKKRISLKNTDTVKNLKKAYASEQAYLCYKKFLVGGNQVHLKEAKNLFIEAKSFIAGE